MSKNLLSGAEALAIILSKEKVKYVFAYPGTSELAICDAVLNKKKISLINGRGDKESAFMAAGGSLLNPATAVALLHGARGLTNAAGAIADANRNEIGTVFLVGLPSSSSARFLPPHGEHKLIESIGNFTKNYSQISQIPSEKDSPQIIENKAKVFISQVRTAFDQSRMLPIGPTILGIPQDVAEKKWIPSPLIKNYKARKTYSSQLDKVKIKQAISLIKSKNRKIIFVDDFLYKNPKAKQSLKKFAQAINAPVFQVFYGRGPMLFEKSLIKQNPYFVGTYHPYDQQHKKTMLNANLLITLEDRNMYQRVVGEMPTCSKIAITSNFKMTQKNNYLKNNDLMLAGDVAIYIQEITDRIQGPNNSKLLKKQCAQIRKLRSKRIEIDPKYDFMRRFIVEELAAVFKKVPKPILLDDSQMFGGLINESYQKFPAKLRVFGDHGAFIGGGLPLATGLAKCETKASVFNTLGDQSFTNSIQGLIAAVQENIKIVYIVCNNGQSVSLLKQTLSQNALSFEKGKNKFLFNAHYDYSKLAKSIGIDTFTIKFDPKNLKKEIKNPRNKFRKALNQALKINGPVLIELKLPSDHEAWKGIWRIKGNETH